MDQFSEKAIAPVPHQTKLWGSQPPSALPRFTAVVCRHAAPLAQRTVIKSNDLTPRCVTPLAAANQLPRSEIEGCKSLHHCWSRVAIKQPLWQLSRHVTVSAATQNTGHISGQSGPQRDTVHAHIDGRISMFSVCC